MIKITDVKGKEVKKGDRILVKQEDFYRLGHGAPTRVLRVYRLDPYYAVCYFSQGWSFMDDLTLWNIREENIKTIIPPVLIEKNDLKLIKAFVKLEGFDVEEDGIEL